MGNTAPWNWLEQPPAHHRDHALSDWRRETIATLAEARVAEDPGFVAIVDGVRSMTRRERLAEPRALAAA